MAAIAASSWLVEALRCYALVRKSFNKKNADHFSGA
jgi:hypothetical protein